MSLRCFLSTFGSIGLTVWEEMLFEEFQDGHHFWYRNGTISAVLILYNPPMPQIKFRLNPTYGLGGDVIWRISTWPPWRPSWISEWNYFSNFESLCHCDTSHQVLAQSYLRFGRRCRLKNFKMVTMAGHLGYLNGTILVILNLCVTPMPPQVSTQYDIQFGSRCHLKNFKTATVAATLDNETEQI